MCRKLGSSHSASQIHFCQWSSTLQRLQRLINAWYLEVQYPSTTASNTPISHANMENHMAVQAGADSVDESDGTDVHGCLLHIRRTGAVSLRALRNDPQENTRHHIEHCPVRLPLPSPPCAVCCTSRMAAPHRTRLNRCRSSEQSNTAPKESALRRWLRVLRAAALAIALCRDTQPAR